MNDRHCASVLLEKQRNGVATVTLNRPHVLNALDVPAKEQLAAIWQEISEDSAIRVAVLTGAGSKAFCAGSDIKEISQTGRMVSTDTLLRAIPGIGIPLDKPVIAALHGYCIGFGMTLALHCDLRVGARDAVLGYPEVRHGMISAVSALRLPQVIASVRAFEMLVLGRNYSAGEAMQLGLLNAVVEDADAEAQAWAARIAGYSPAAVQATKRLALFKTRLSEAERNAIEAARAFVESRDDYKEGAAAFTERR
ncbi:MAG TPA: enoyl-CoA hydratase-related protein [Xanthobacteraceae bacterium]|jgi:enoyl-CoA hydratase/carnithine racemase